MTTVICKSNQSWIYYRHKCWFWQNQITTVSANKGPCWCLHFQVQVRGWNANEEVQFQSQIHEFEGLSDTKTQHRHYETGFWSWATILPSDPERTVGQNTAWGCEDITVWEVTCALLCIPYKVSQRTEHFCENWKHLKLSKILTKIGGTSLIKKLAKMPSLLTLKAGLRSDFLLWGAS